MSDKPVKAKPYFYSCCLQTLQEIAKNKGYNLLIHGSMNRDLVAVPWVDEPGSHLELLQEFEMYLKGIRHTDLQGYQFGMLPGGRSNYIIDLNRGGRYNNYTDEQYYLDISFTPLLKKEA